MAAKHKTSMSLLDSTEADLDALAEQMGVPKSEVVRRGVALLAMLMGERSTHRVILRPRGKNGKARERELVLL